MKTTSCNTILETSITFKLLEVFFKYPSREFYESQIKKESKLSVGATNKYMRKFVKDKLVLLEKKGKMKFYSLNKNNPIVKQLKITYSISLPNMQKIRKFGEKIKMEIYLFGSTARGEDDENSDIDLLAIGKNIKDSGKLKNIDNKIKVSFYTQKEWNDMRKKDPAFFERVEKDKIRLV